MELKRELSSRIAVGAYILKSDDMAKHLKGLSKEQRSLLWNLLGEGKEELQI